MDQVVKVCVIRTVGSPRKDVISKCIRHWIYPGLLPELRKISDDWLRKKNTREKGFSLGYFDEQYLLNFPVAVVKLQGKNRRLC